MTTVTAGMRLTLSVSNPQALQKGTSPSFEFGTSGGSIGSEDASWLLHDRGDRVVAHHCDIGFADGGYLVTDRCGRTFVNEQNQPLGLGTSVRLSNMSRLRIGPYDVAVHLIADRHHLPDQSRTLGQHNVEELVQATMDPLDNLPTSTAEENESCADPAQEAFRKLAELPAHLGQLDPLLALELDSETPAKDLESKETMAVFQQHDLASTPAQPITTTAQLEAVFGLPAHVSGETSMSEQDSSSLAEHTQRHAQHSSASGPLCLTSPLLAGIGVPAGALDTQDSQALLYEAGQSLGALIRGLSALHNEQPMHRLAPAARTLQPIEENPLRLGQGYPETVRALFSRKRSPVHLSPAAAIEESLEQIQRQRRATHTAIAAGLDALLQTFSPQQLQSRFNRYRSPQTAVGDNGEGPWQMYGHYYDELISTRQQGFEKLFWEVFEQAFDQSMRAEAQ